MPLSREKQREGGGKENQVITYPKQFFPPHSLDHLAVAAAAALAAQRLLGPHAEHILQRRRQWRLLLAAPDALVWHQDAGAARGTVRMTLALITLSSKHINALALCGSTNTAITSEIPPSLPDYTHRHKYSHRLRWGSNRR